MVHRFGLFLGVVILGLGLLLATLLGLHDTGDLFRFSALVVSVATVAYAIVRGLGWVVLGE